MPKLPKEIKYTAASSPTHSVSTNFSGVMAMRKIVAATVTNKI